MLDHYAACFKALYCILMSSESGDFRGRHVETCPPLSSKGNKLKNPGESWLWTVPLPCVLRTPRSASVLIGSSRAWAMKHSFCDHVFEVSSWPLLLSFPLGVTIQSKDSVVSTSTRFTKLLMATLLRWAKSPWNPFLKDSWRISVLRQCLPVCTISTGRELHTDSH